MTAVGDRTSRGMSDAVAAAIAVLPQLPGVYRFSDGSGRVLYIGRATQLRNRVRSYWGDLGDRAHLASMVRRIASIEAVVCASVHEGAWLERNLIAARKPPWNRGLGGAEVEVYLRLRDGDLEVVHTPDPADGARRFGPYLGGVRTRCAVDGLHRLFPIRYASAAAGTERGMAEALGIGQGDRDGMVRALTAVLQRRPAAVRRARRTLIARRDQLAAVQSYEAAAGVQAELEAIEWICAEQNVCLLEPQDHDLVGWAGGREVHFGMRAGRITSWTAQECPLEQSRPAIEATPMRWREFTRRNAELAAALSAVGGT
ncbi:hypothetical protein [Microlunatus soli]|uniref:Excinuclease ABC subunit C n=1 Tax=Microlunatus soli TaxID=630515 RepID=A0A1H1VNN4_9ACTN|nr:hypothetical protein [Microlunatus soli]SDS86432.1 excinuclease ABC subunit C [Microlunatus soli]